MPFQPAVAREEQDAHTALAVRQLFAARAPAGIRVEKVNAAQRSADAGRLTLPALAAVHCMPDYSFIADGPAFPFIDKLNGVKSRVLKIA